MQIGVFGGCGYVGLPLSIALARHHQVNVQDIDADAVALVAAGRMPFAEAGAAEEIGPSIGDYLGDGLPIAASDVEEVSTLIRRDDAGVACPPTVKRPARIELAEHGERHYASLVS